MALANLLTDSISTALSKAIAEKYKLDGQDLKEFIQTTLYKELGSKPPTTEPAKAPTKPLPPAKGVPKASTIQKRSPTEVISKEDFDKWFAFRGGKSPKELQEIAKGLGLTVTSKTSKKTLKELL
jgi:hypothetical protein